MEKRKNHFLRLRPTTFFLSVFRLESEKSMETKIVDFNIATRELESLTTESLNSSS